MMCNRPDRHFPRVRQAVLYFVLIFGFATLYGEDTDAVTITNVPAPVAVRHLFGFEGVNNKKVRGNLFLDGHALQFHFKGESAVPSVELTSIQNAEVGTEARQVGGVPMALGRAAVPYEGGRLVSLVSRKKFDTLTVTYTDSNGGLHEAVFEFGKGKAPAVRDQLLSNKTRRDIAIAPAQAKTPEAITKIGRCCAIVQMVDLTHEVLVEPAFRAAIYENLLKEIGKSNVFSEVFRSGDHNAEDVSDLLVIRTTVSKYSPGSETLRSLTTFAGATKITLRMQIYTQSGALLIDREVSGSVRFFGDNMKATSSLAHNVAKSIKHDVAASADVRIDSRKAR